MVIQIRSLRLLSRLQIHLSTITVTYLSSAFDRTTHFETKLFNKNFHTESTQQAITSSKLTVKTPEQCVKYIQSYR